MARDSVLDNYVSQRRVVTLKALGKIIAFDCIVLFGISCEPQMVGLSG